MYRTIYIQFTEQYSVYSTIYIQCTEQYSVFSKICIVYSIQNNIQYKVRCILKYTVLVYSNKKSVHYMNILKLRVCLSNHRHLYIYLSIYLFIYLFLCLSIYLSIVWEVGRDYSYCLTQILDLGLRKMKKKCYIYARINTKLSTPLTPSHPLYN